MPPRSRAPKKRVSFDNPEAFSSEVRPHVVAIQATRALIDRYETLVEDLPSFVPLLNRFAELRGKMDEIADYIKTYLAQDDEQDFDSFEYEMSHLAGELESVLDDTPIDTRARKNASPLEDQLFSDVGDLMERIWVIVSDQGYKLHTAMIRA